MVLNTVAANSVISPAILFNFQPWNMTGAFFTGLAPGATFLIRTVFYVERFPSPDENDLVLVTKPSAKFDPLALEIYDHMVHNMPVGVPVADNGLGEWFYEAIKSAASLVLPGITKALTPSMAPPPVSYSTSRTPAFKPRKALPVMKQQRMATTSPRIPRLPSGPSTPNVVKGMNAQQTKAEISKYIRAKQLRGEQLSAREIAFIKRG